MFQASLTSVKGIWTPKANAFAFGIPNQTDMGTNSNRPELALRIAGPRQTPVEVLDSGPYSWIQI